MPNTYRLVERSGELLANARSIDGVRIVAAELTPDRYDVDEIRDAIGLDGNSSRRAGVALKCADGSVVVEPKAAQPQV